MKMTIPEMSPQQEGVIYKIKNTTLDCVQRLMTFGLVEGTTIKYIGSAAGTIEIQIYGASLALRKDCASHFIIKDIN